MLLNPQGLNLVSMTRLSPTETLVFLVLFRLTFSWSYFNWEAFRRTTAADTKPVVTDCSHGIMRHVWTCCWSGRLQQQVQIRPSADIRQVNFTSHGSIDSRRNESRLEVLSDSRGDCRMFWMEGLCRDDLLLENSQQDLFLLVPIHPVDSEWQQSE